MEVTGEITATEVNIQIDTDDITEEVVDNIDWEDKISGHIDVGSEVESLLDQYHDNDSPCGVGKSFEKAVWWAMSRRVDNDSNYVAADSNDSTPAGLRILIREELRSLVRNL